MKFVPLLLAVCLPQISSAETLVPVLVTNHTTFRIMAANITSGNNQRYERPGLNIMKALKPDIVAIQEFSYSSTNGNGINTAAAIREMINWALGTNFVYYRESGKNIPNGIISRFPILQSGSWEDPQVNDREFAWARLDIPGPTDLYVVSVHLHSGGGASSRSTEATRLKDYIQTHVPAGAYVVVAGDFNTDSRSETALNTFKSFLSDASIPNDGTASDNPNTNASRKKPYDYVLASFNLESNRVATVVGSRTFPNGLVFDSRVYSPLSEVPPVQSSDSSAFQMQHMAVIKDFRVTEVTTNHVALPQPQMALSNHVLRWQSPSNFTWRVQHSEDLSNWFDLQMVTSASTNFVFTNPAPEGARTFYRLRYP